MENMKYATKSLEKTKQAGKDIAGIKKNYGIAVTGGIATGKSTLCQVIASLGYKTISADMLSREVMAPKGRAYKLIKDSFPTSIFCNDGSIDRKALRELIFNDTAYKKKLETIVHPAIRLHLEVTLKDYFSTRDLELWFYEAPLIFETHQERDFFQVWVTDISPAVQIKRLCKRDNISKDQALRIINNQLPQSEKVAKSDFKINMESPLDLVENKVREEINRLEQKLPQCKE